MRLRRWCLRSGLRRGRRGLRCGLWLLRRYLRLLRCGLWLWTLFQAPRIVATFGGLVGGSVIGVSLKPLLQPPLDPRKKESGPETTRDSRNDFADNLQYAPTTIRPIISSIAHPPAQAAAAAMSVSGKSRMITNAIADIMMVSITAFPIILSILPDVPLRIPPPMHPPSAWCPMRQKPSCWIDCFHSSGLGLWMLTGESPLP